ncbi:MAG: beta-lactamase family protein [Chloroflexi bacterium]|nr:beta-lactamase family protein [Chloroflexota bacterium]
MAQDPRKTVQEAVDTAIGKGGELGIQVAAYLDGKLVIDVWAGIADETTGRKVDADTLFPAFSVAKGVTVTALHIQAERGLIDYEAPIVRYWPEFGVHGKDKATVYDALTHRLGVPLAPLGVTPDLLADWDWMVKRIADMHPLFEPGTKSAYHPYTFGWVIGEIVRRTDPKRRPFCQFVQEEIVRPLRLDDLYMGAPDRVHLRIARLRNLPPIPPGAPGIPPDLLYERANPFVVSPREEVYGLPVMRRACNPSGGLFTNARSLARFFAVLANGGELDGVRLLSKERVQLFSVPRPPSDWDYTLGTPHRGSITGFHLAGSLAMYPAGNGARVFGSAGAGGAVGWCDPDTHLAVGITHNRMFSASTPEANPLTPVGAAVRAALGLPI